jgi:hypothetical protein
MQLQGLSFMLDLQLKRAEDGFRNALALNTPSDRFIRRFQFEGAMSAAWQAYCTFVRHLCIESSRGCTTSAGISHGASIMPVSWERASYIAGRAARQRTIHATGLNNLLLNEPTWGDSNKIVDVIDHLNPGNKNILKRYLAGGLNGPKHSQIVRNACAHTNQQTKAAVSALAVSYIAHPINHPTDALTWVDPVSSDFAFVSWLDDMRAIGMGAVS